jgi:hypothetical protein
MQIRGNMIGDVAQFEIHRRLSNVGSLVIYFAQRASGR